MDMAFEVVDRHQRFVEGESQRLRKRNPHQKSACQPRPRSNSDRVQVAVLKTGLGHGFPNHRCNVAKMLTRRQLRHHAPV